MSFRQFLFLIVNTICCFVLFCHPAFAQEKSPPILKENTIKKQKVLEENQRRVETYRQKSARQHEMMLKKLKKVDPEKYQRLSAIYERQKKIRDILERYRANKLTLPQARTLLSPLMKAQSQSDLASLPERISKLKKNISQLRNQLENARRRRFNPGKEIRQLGKEITQADKRLKQLKKIQEQPQSLIDARVNYLLGQLPSYKDFFAINP